MFHLKVFIILLYYYFFVFINIQIAFASVFGSIYIINYHIIIIAAGQTFFGFLFAAVCSLTFDFWIPPSGYADHYQFFFSTSWQVS